MSEKPKVAVEIDELNRLKRVEEFLEALQQGGVNNWDWYGDSIQQYLKCNNLPEDYFEGI